MTGSEYNIDPNYLSRCSTEFFAEASWEQVDKQDTEVKERFPNPVFVVFPYLHVMVYR